MARNRWDHWRIPPELEPTIQIILLHRKGRVLSSFYKANTTLTQKPDKDTIKKKLKKKCH